MEKLGYIHRNPVACELAERPEDWLWSSFRHDLTGTNRTFCSSTSMVFHGIRYTPALATLARKCKGGPETSCKGCHETEHTLWQGAGDDYDIRQMNLRQPT